MVKFKIYYVIFILIFLSFFNVVKAADLTDYFSVDDVKMCNNQSCSTIYDENNGVKGLNNFLVRITWSLHSPLAINNGDTVTIPFANEIETNDTSSFDSVGFDWDDIYDVNNNKIGKWKMDRQETERKISIVFSDNAVGKYDINGIFITPRNIRAKYCYTDKIIPLTVGNNTYHIKILTYSLSEYEDNSTISNTNSSNNLAVFMAVSPKKTIKQLYDINNYSNLTNSAILKNLYFEIPIPENLNAEIDKVTFSPVVTGPTSLTDLKSSKNVYQLITMGMYSDELSGFTKITQNVGESYQEFKNRLNKFEYGIYRSGNNKIIVVNFGNQPSLDITYRDYVHRIDNSLYEIGDYLHNVSPFGIDNQVKGIINNIFGSTNRIGGKVVLWAANFSLMFPTVKVNTTKRITGIWSWEDENNDVKSEQIDVDANLIVPQSIATVSGVSKLLLRDLDSKNEIIGARVKLQKKNGNTYEDIGSAITDSTGMVMFNNLESGNYRYVQETYLNHYIDNSFIMYEDEDMVNVITNFEFDANNGNIIYATNEREKYTITYMPGEHGNFANQEFIGIPYGDPTPNFDAYGSGDWIFKGWSPDKDLFVTENKTYTADWKKMVKVTTKYLEEETNTPLLQDIVDIDENNTEYLTEEKEFDNYNFYRVEGNVSGIRGEEDIVVTYYYKKKEANLNIKYLDCLTRMSIASDNNITVYYGDEYDSDNYEVNKVIPVNYNRISTSKTSNYRGVVSMDNINVEYCYTKKDSIINTSVTKNGTSRITQSSDKVAYQINYYSTYTDYIGSASITIVDTLPYRIDVNNSNLDGGVYNDSNKTITWIVNANINSYNSSEYNLTKNIEILYIDLDKTRDDITNNVTSNTVIENKQVNSETNYNTFVDIKGTITVKYLDSITNEELIDTIITTDKVGREYELISNEIEGYKLINRPENDIYEYTEENQEFKFIYERIKYKIKVNSNEGGKVTGDEEVYYGEDSTINNIKIDAEDGYYIKSITINGKKVEILENQKNLVIPNFTNMKEDKLINVEFDKISTDVKVPDTKRKASILFIFIGIITILFSGIILLKNGKIFTILNKK